MKRIPRIQTILILGVGKVEIIMHLKKLWLRNACKEIMFIFYKEIFKEKLREVSFETFYIIDPIDKNARRYVR